MLISADHYLRLWFPNGEIKGNEFEVGSLQGEAGHSLKINIRTGMWKDFATGHSGGDLISLYAAIKGLSQKEAAAELAPLIPSFSERFAKPPRPSKKTHNIIQPPKGTPLPNMVHGKYGKPSEWYRYTNHDGETLFLVARYDHDGTKDLIPYCYTTDEKWINRMWPGLRPLYGLGPDLLNAKNVLIVEGEKAVNAAKKIIGEAGRYHVVTWSGGAQAHDKTDWTPLFSKNVLIWPDADEAGKRAADQIASRLLDRAKEIKIIELGDINGGWDAADALSEGMGWSNFLEWAKPRVKIFTSLEAASKLPPIRDLELEYDNSIEGRDGQLATDNYVSIDVPPEITRLWRAAGLILAGQSKTPVMSEDNVMRLLNYTNILRGGLWFDEFYCDILTNWNGITRPWSDREMVELLIRFQHNYGFQRLAMRTLETSIRAYAYRNKRSAARDYFESLKWDGISRVEYFFTEYLNAPDDTYTKSASKNWWISMVARAISPGCQVDNMVIFEGIQGARKTTLLREIAQEWYVEATAPFGTKDFYQQIQGKLIIEIAELDMFSKSDVNTLKRVVSSTTDEFRAPYERRPGKFDRSCIFVGTTNQDGYLMDETGNRRYWPVPVKNIDIERVKKDRELLFAEAVTLFKQGENWWDMPDAETKEMQAQRMAEDPWFGEIEKYVKDPTIKYGGVTCTEIATNCLKIEIGKLSRRETVRIGKCLRQLGWQPRVVKEGKSSIKRFVQPDSERLGLEQAQIIEKKEIKNYAPRGI